MIGFPQLLIGFALCLTVLQTPNVEFCVDNRFTKTISAQETTAANNQSPVVKKDASTHAALSVVERYLKLSADGAWLTYDGRVQIGQLTEWTPNEQHMMSIHVISSYRVISARSEGNAAEIIVEFDGVGWLVEDFYKFETERNKFRSFFRLAKKENGAWQIVQPEGPAIHWSPLVKYVEKIAPNMGNPAYFHTLAKQIADAAKQHEPMK